jgi:hypothetical protein
MSDAPGSGAPGSGAGAGAGAGAGSSGASDNPFLQTLPEEFRGEAALKDIKDLGALAKGYVHAQKLVGAKGVIIPGENAKPEEIEAFYTALGRPKAPAEYGFKDDGLPKDMLGREGLVNAVQGIMHKAGVSKKAAEEIFNGYSAYMKAEMEKIGQNLAAEKTKRVEAIKKEFGAEFDKNMAIARGVAKKFDPSGTLAKWLDETGHGDHPDLIKAFLSIGKAIGPDQFITGDGRPAGTNVTQQEALEKIKTLKADAAWVKKYLNKGEPGHKEAVEEHQKLMEIAYPS